MSIQNGPSRPNYSKERRIKNEQMFREHNSRIEQSAGSLLRQASVATGDFPIEFACECSDASCLTKISLSIAAFHKLRNMSEEQYILVSGHEQIDIETVVQIFDGYITVIKTADTKKLNDDT